MVRILVEGTKTFCIHDDHLDWVTVGRLTIQWLRPHPNTFGAGIDGGTNSKSVTSVKEHPIQKITFACSIHSCHCDNTDWSFQLGQELSTFLIDFEHSLLFVEDNERDCLLDLRNVWIVLCHQHLIIHITVVHSYCSLFNNSITSTNF